MHKIKEMLCDEVHEIEKHELSPNRVHLLGEMIDILKDLKYMEYLDCKMERYMKEGTVDSSHDIKSFLREYHTYETKKSDYIKTKDASKKFAMQNCLSDLFIKHGDLIKDMVDLFTLEEEKEVVRKYS